MLKDRRPSAALSGRVPKYDSFILRGGILPPSNDFGFKGPSADPNSNPASKPDFGFKGQSPAYESHLEELLRRVLPEEELLRIRTAPTIYGGHEGAAPARSTDGESSEHTTSVIFSTDGSEAAGRLCRDLTADLRSCGVLVFTAEHEVPVHDNLYIDTSPVVHYLGIQF